MDPSSAQEFLLLLTIGLFVGCFGTLIGAGGGFLLVPLLLLLTPKLTPANITAMSLTVVFFNAYGGTWAYAQKGRIDYAAGVLFALAGVPGAVIGTWIVGFIPRGSFDLIFAALLVGLGLFLIVQPMGTKLVKTKGNGSESELADGRRRLLTGALGSAYLGVVSSLLGIGGGILHVPFLVRVLHFPPHIATATSQFVLLIVAFAGAAAHLCRGELDAVLGPTAVLALGVMMGAPVGAAVSHWLRGPWLIRLIALAVTVVGCRLMWRWLVP